MTNGEILEKLFPGFEEIQVFSEYILRNSKETIIKVDREFWESEMREATQEEREGVEQYIDSIAETCEDAISRQAVMEVIKKCHCEEWVKTEIGAPIEALSSVTPAEKVGRWIKICFTCNRCWVTSASGVKYNYCPHCGSRMMEEEVEE